MTANSAPGLSTATALFFTWSLLTFLVRLWVKLRRTESWGWDDSTISAALLIALCQVASTFWAIHDGYGQSWSNISEDSKTKIEKSLFAGQIFYILSIGLTKISTAFFIVRLTRKGQRIRLAYGGAAICGVWTVASIFIVAIRGNIVRPWEEIDGSKALFARWIGIEAVGVVIEIALWALAINLIWSLNMKLQKRLLVLAIFSARLLLIPIIGGRLFYLSPSENFDPTSTSVTGAIYTQAVLEFAFMSTSITCLKPFLQPFHSGFFVSSTGASGSRMQIPGAKSKEPYYMLSAVSGTDRDGTVRTMNDSRSETPGDKEAQAHVGFAGTSNNSPLRPDLSGHQATISTAHTIDSDEIPLRGSKPGKSPEPDHMVISKTQAWSVRYEDDENPGEQQNYHAMSG